MYIWNSLVSSGIANNILIIHIKPHSTISKKKLLFQLQWLKKIMPIVNIAIYAEPA